MLSKNSTTVTLAPRRAHTAWKKGEQSLAKHTHGHTQAANTSRVSDTENCLLLWPHSSSILPLQAGLPDPSSRPM